MKILPYLRNLSLKILFIYTFLRFGFPLEKKGGLIPNDFQIFYTALERLRLGQSFYIASDASPFKYSPAFLHAFEVTLGTLAPEWGWCVYLFISLLVWFGALHLWFQNKTTSSLLFFGLGWLASWHGFLEHLSYGQADFLTFGFFVLAALLLNRSRQNFGALCFAVALLIKPLSLFFATGPLLIHPSREKSFWVIKSILIAATLLFFSSSSLEIQNWITSLSLQPPNLFFGNINQSTLASILRWTHQGVSSPFISLGQIFCLGLLLVLFIFGFAVSLFSRQKSEPIKGIALGVLFYLLLNPLSWRWLSFAWILPFTTFNPRNKSTTFWAGLTLTVALILMLQKNISKLLGITEIDVLSGYGFYTIVSFLLTILLLQENQNSGQVSVPRTSFGQTHRKS